MNLPWQNGQMDTNQSPLAPDHLRAVEKILGFVLLFVGFVPVSFSLAMPMFEVGIAPFLMFLGGVILTAHSVSEHWSRWIIIGIAVGLDIAILIHGEVMLWHKQVVFAIAVVGGSYALLSQEKKAP